MAASTYVLAAFLLLLTISRLGSSFRMPTLITYCARVIVSFLCLILCAFYGVIASSILWLAGYRGLSQWTVARLFKWTMQATNGVTFVVQDEHHLQPRPAVFISNHQTELDVLMLGCVFPPYCSVTAKKSLKWTPFLGWFMTLSATVFIDRADRTSARAAFDSAAKHMRTARQSVFIFPEGTRSHTTQPDMLAFKKGAFHLAVQAKVPIVPIVVANYASVLHLSSRTFTEGAIPVKVLPPISTEKLGPADVEDLSKMVREQMMAELVTLTEIARGQKIAPSLNDASS